MIRAGILSENDAVELLEGFLVAKMPKDPQHSLATQLLCDVIAAQLPGGWHVSDQEPITTEDSEPEPDVIVVRGERRDYRERPPGPAEIALVIEVANTTLQHDCIIKAALYARAGITIYWIVNLNERQIEVYSEPLIAEAGAAAYQQRQDYVIDDSVPLYLAGRVVAQLPVPEFLP
jgi:Uma2 family endonuclease